jgi:hypothetical protein
MKKDTINNRTRHYYKVAVGATFMAPKKGSINRTPTRLILLAITAMLLTVPAYAETISSTDLIEKASYYNNKTVEYQGEVIGDVMVRGDYAWVNLNDGINAIGIWAKKDLLAGLIKYRGDYNYKGDILLVNGIFHRACPQHGGDLDIHLEAVAKIKDGFATPHPLSFRKLIQALAVFIMALGFAILYNLRRKTKQ